MSSTTFRCSVCVVETLLVIVFSSSALSSSSGFVARRVGVGRVEGVFLLCVVNVNRVLSLSPVDSAVFASPFLLCFCFS